MKIQVEISWLAVFSLQTTGALAQLYNQVADTTYGPIQGYAAFNSSSVGNISNWEDITVWKGILFAANTSGINRFRAL